MRQWLLAGAVIVSASCQAGAPSASGEYLFVWAGDSAGTASDFLAVIDAAPSSPHYGAIVASLPTGQAGTHPHHTEAELGASQHLLANGFGAGRTWLFDLSAPLTPRILTSFGDLAGFSHPHTFVRLADGNVLATFQYKADSAAAPMQGHDGMSGGLARTTGGLVEMDERGRVIKRASATDSAITERHIYPYSVLPIPALDLAVSTTTDMNEANKAATSEWVQFWRLSDLKLLHSIALAPGPRGDEHLFTGEPLLLPDGKSIYIHTFNCGLYLVRGLESDRPISTFIQAFEGQNCGVPVLTSHYWLQTVPKSHALVALDIADPKHPREVSTLKLGDDVSPHWLAIDRTGRRLVVNSSNHGPGNRLLIVNFDPAKGALTLDERFRDVGAALPGVSFTQRTWSHGFTGTAVPHGTVFSR